MTGFIGDTIDLFLRRGGDITGRVETEYRLEGVLWEDGASLDKREICAGAEAAYSDAVGVVLRRMSKDVVDDVLGVLDSGGEGMFGGKTVFDVEDGGVGLGAEFAAESVVGAVKGEDEATTVEVDVYGGGSFLGLGCGKRMVDVSCDGAIGAAGGDVQNGIGVGGWEAIVPPYEETD